MANDFQDYTTATKDKLNFIALEYSHLRQSLLSFFQTQITVLTIGIGLVSGLIVYGIIELPDMDSELIPQISTALFCAIIPGAYAFLSVIWFDFTHRQVETGAYLSVLEVKMKIITKCDEPYSYENPSFTFMWEHWNKAQFSSKKRNLLKQSNQIFYYVCIGLFGSLPLASLILWILFFRLDMATTIIGIGVFAIIYGIMVFFAYLYIKAILNFKKKITSTALCPIDIHLDCEQNKKD